MEHQMTDAEMVEGADRRARIRSWFANHPGEDTDRHKMAEVLGTSDIGTVGKLLTELAEQGEINMRKEGNANRYWRGVLQEERNPPKQKRVKALGAGELPADVELVIDGKLTIVVGRNPQTGRLRVTFFDD